MQENCSRNVEHIIAIKEKPGKLLGMRHLQTFLLFTCSTLSYVIRFNASVAVVAMTNKNTTNPDFEEFEWKEAEKNYILGAFFWGYLLTQVPGGWLSTKYGSTLLLLSSVLVPSILSLITPVTVHYGGWITYCGIRFIEGIFQGFIFPCFHTLLAKWSPFDERNRLVTFSHSGIEFGTVLAFLTSGFIAASPLGWPGISYVAGSLGLIWSAIWFYYGANTPAESKHTSLQEREYIENSLKQFNESKNKNLLTPWKSIWTSIPFLALFATRTSQAWGFTFLLYQIPTYLNSIMKMDIQSNAIYSAIPYALTMIVTFVTIYIADLLSKHNVRLVVIRKIYNTISFWIPGMTILSLGFITVEHRSVAIGLLLLTVGCNGTQILGSVLNHIDLSPNFAGVLMGITNTSASLVSMILPIINAEIVNNEKDLSQWRIMFGLASAVYFVGNLIYILYASTDRQPWDNPEFTKKNLK